jgi:ketosteroid isomerase-like protein
MKSGLWLASTAAALAAGVALGARAPRDTVSTLLQLDRDFDRATAERGTEGWLSYFAEDGIMMPSNAHMVVGKEAIRKFVGDSFSNPGYSLRWEPVDGSLSGDLGYTYGVYKSTRVKADGTRASTYGKYVTIWRRQPDHSWKIVMDVGNASPAPQKPNGND